MEDGTVKTGFAQDFMLPDVATLVILPKVKKRVRILTEKR